MSTLEHSQQDAEEDARSLPSQGRTSSEHQGSAPRQWPAEMSIPDSRRSSVLQPSPQSLPTELNDEDALPWTPGGDEAQQSVFSGASPSLDGYLQELDGSPTLQLIRLNSVQELDRDYAAQRGYSETLSELPPEPGIMPPGTPQSTRDTKEVPPEPNYLSDSQLYPDIRHRRHASASSARLRALPSLRRGDAGRRRTAVLERKRNNVMKQALSRGTVAPGQPAKVWRVRDGKFHQMEWKGPTNLEARFLVFFCAVCSAMVWFA